jgi:hypothetical protein
MWESTNEGAVLRVLPRETFVAGLFEAGMIAMNAIECMVITLPDTWVRFSRGPFSCAQFRAQRARKRGWVGLKPKVFVNTQTNTFLAHSALLKLLSQQF